MNKEIFFTAGPTQLHPQYNNFYLRALDENIGSINHRSAAFRTIYQRTDEALRELLHLTPNHYIFFAGSATEIWERMLLNLVEQKSHHIVHGSFGKKFYDYSLALGKHATKIEATHGESCIAAALEASIETELICTTQNETSSGVCIAPEQLTKLKKNNANALLCTDLVSIAPISAIDYNYVDSSFFSVQKAFGMPAGLGVWIANEQCIAKAERVKNSGANIGAHHTLELFYSNYKKWETPSTPNVMAIDILGKIAAQFNKQGIAALREEIATKAQMLYTFAEGAAWCTPLVKDKEQRSESVVVLQCNNDCNMVIQQLKEKGSIVSSGYGAGKGTEIRIANFPSTSIEQMEALIQKLREI